MTSRFHFPSTVAVAAPTDEVMANMYPRVGVEVFGSLKFKRVYRYVAEYV
jgi:hypothetical protein